MLCIESLIFSSFLTALIVGTDVVVEDESLDILTTSGTDLPIVLQMTTTMNFDSLEVPTTEIKSKSEEEIKAIGKDTNYHLNSNDIEVFNGKFGPQMEKQEEQEEVEEEKEAEVNAQVEAIGEERKLGKELVKDEVEPEAEESKEEKEVLTEGGIETTSEAISEEKKHEQEPVVDSETENQPTLDGTETSMTTSTNNEDSEMSNDEPLKDQPNIAKDPLMSHTIDETTKVINDNDGNEIVCYICTSSDDLKCHKNPTQQIPCPKMSKSQKEKYNGCYTLYETDMNITIRGCLENLAEESFKYCLTNDKFCRLCYKSGCNNKTAPNSANVQQFHIYLLLTLNMVYLITIKKFI